MNDREPSTTPAFFANLVTAHVMTDEVSLEFRRFFPTHRDLWQLSSGGQKPIPSPSDEEIYKIAPIAKVVITFSAAKALRDALNNFMPPVEALRKQQG